MSRRTTPRQAMIPVSKGRSTPPCCPRNLRTDHTTKSVSKRKTQNSQQQRHLRPLDVLTISQEVQKHLHFRQRPDACEVGPLRVAGLRRLLPSSFCFSQHPVAEPIMWPPTAAAFCMNILPVLWKRKSDSERNCSKKKKKKAHICFTYTQLLRPLCSRPPGRATAEVKGHFPNAIQLRRAEDERLT